MKILLPDLKKEYLKFFFYANKNINFILVIIIAAIIVLMKSDFEYFISNSLWAEDSKVFLNQAYEIGVSSLFEPYAGYLLFYPRIVALFSTLFSLQFAPYIFFYAWFFVCILALWATINISIKNEIPHIIIIPSITIVFLPPHTDEVYFTLTNAQWLFPIYLSILMIYGRQLGNINCLLILIGSLTGPFSVILAPFVILSLFIRGNKVGTLALFLFFLGAVVQFTMIVTIGQGTGIDINENVYSWLDLFSRFFLFGNNSPLGVFLGISFWLSILLLVFICSIKKQLKCSLLNIILLLFGFAVLAASFWLSRGNPESIGPLSAGARYFFIPYCISAIFCLFCYNINKYISIFSLLIFSFISFISFNEYQRDDVYFEEYAYFHEEFGGFIPVHPRSPIYPGWNTYIYDWDEKHFLSNRTLLDKYTVPDGFISGNDIYWNNIADPKIFFENTISCSSKHIIGLVVRFESNYSGWSQLFWAEEEGFSEKNSFSIYHNSGASSLNYVIPKSYSSIKVRFDLPAGTDKISLTDVSYVCVKVK